MIHSGNVACNVGLQFGRLGQDALLALCLIFAACSAVSVPVANAATGANAAAASRIAAPADLTRVTLSPVDGARCKEAPVTFGQTFAPGDLPEGKTLRAIYNEKSVPLQVEIKARHADGSARHAVLTMVGPCKSGSTVALLLAPVVSSQSPAPTMADVLATAFETRLTLEDDAGRVWSISAREALKRAVAAGGCQSSSITCKRWLDGPLASEWILGVSLDKGEGAGASPLMVYFAVRAYGKGPVQQVRVDVIVENTWAYRPNPSNLRYSPVIKVGDNTVYAPGPITHYRQARWHQAVWWGTESNSAPLYAAVDPDYLQATKAVPEYDAIRISNKTKAQARQHCGPMKSCDQTKQMQNTGAQAAIGPLPRWSAAYVIDNDYRLYRWMLANADALGAYGVHYRTRDTGDVLSVEAHPCATTVYPARVKRCGAQPHGDDRFPDCGSQRESECKSPLNADIAHHPAPAYVAYLVTGDWYYMSEMTYWATWAAFWQNPKYRDYSKALVHRTQVRGQAWMLRTLGDAAYLLPDDASHKAYFNQVVANNIAWYNERYTRNPTANQLGAIVGYHAVVYPDGGQQRVGIASWQQAFFTWAAGNLADQGFAGAGELRDWVSGFAVGTMTAPGFCWELASSYKLRIRDHNKAPYYDTFAKVYAKTFPELKDVGCESRELNAALKLKEGKKRFDYPPGTMVGYPKSDTGFTANLQVGLAAAADSTLVESGRAWSLFLQRRSKPGYHGSPQFAIVPRSISP